MQTSRCPCHRFTMDACECRVGAPFYFGDPRHRYPWWVNPIHATGGQQVAYRHVGELAYLLLVAPWMVPDFDLEADLDALIAVDRDLRGPHGIALSYRRYLVEARKSE